MRPHRTEPKLSVNKRSMANSRPLKTSNWPGILDSKHALRKYCAPHPKMTPLRAALQDRQTTLAPPGFLGAEAMQRPWMNAAWQLARDPSNLSDVHYPKKIKGLRDRERKRLERKVWARPARIDLAQRAARLSSRNLEKPERQEKVVPPPKAVSRATNQRKKVKSPAQHSRKRPAQAITHLHAPRRKDILIVDAKRSPGVERHAHLAGGAEQPQMNSAPGREMDGQRPRLKMSGRSKKSYHVPLCSRPTELMGVGLPYSRQVWMRQQKLCQQPEYHDQYMRMLCQQQRHQQMCQQEQLQQDFARQQSEMAQHPYSSLLQDAMSEEQRQAHVYSVPSKSPLKRLRDGKRLCGNFYYN
ncbi:uncharacterized protein LOC108029409 [Drosophila biarmipes]|uniref:uncharacterized protein LOC108029409 n=1 Tax=Drosophila biarmipes TaxID=125945 RepID=UPI0007E72CFC|nr:uncharacterized protein LOC108029409 [Drosophila biarmipes]